MSRRRQYEEANVALAVREMQLKGAELAVGRQSGLCVMAQRRVSAAEETLGAVEQMLSAVLAGPSLDLQLYQGWRQVLTDAEQRRQDEEEALDREMAALEQQRAAYAEVWAQTEAVRRITADACRRAKRAGEERALAAAEDQRPRQRGAE